MADEHGMIDGEYAMQGTTRKYKYIWVPAVGLQAPGTKPAVLTDYGIGQAHVFTDGTDDTVTARLKVPDDMDITEYPQFGCGWSTPTGSAGNCRWQIEYLYRKPGEAMDAAAEETLTENFAAHATAAGLSVSLQTAGVLFEATTAVVVFRIKRRADEGADTLGEDCHLHGMCLKYRTNKLGANV